VRPLALVAALVTSCAVQSAEARPIKLWHSYRGAEERALQEVVASFSGEVEILGVPDDAFPAKLEAAIPLGEGPDLFIGNHNVLGEYVRQGLVAPLPIVAAEFVAPAMDAVTYQRSVLGIPLSLKCLALYVNTDLVAGTPDALEDLPGAANAPFGKGGYLLAYASRSAYFHEPFLTAFGATLLNEGDRFGFVGADAEASLHLVRSWADRGLVPVNADGALVTQLFGSGKAAYAMSGPWLAADLEESGNTRVRFRVVPLPIVRATGKRMRPFLTVEAVMASPRGSARAEAVALAAHLASAEGAAMRQRLAHVVSARADFAIPSDDALAYGFARAVRFADPMPTSVAMRAVWEPADKAIRKVYSGAATPADALAEAEWRFRDVQRPLPAPASKTPLALVLGALGMLGAFALVRRARDAAFRQRLRASLPAYAYLVHAVVVVGLLVFAPLIAGAAISLCAGRPGQQYYVGLANFAEIITARGGPLLATGSFYYVLFVTLGWTVLNLALHLGIGMTLGVLLSRPMLRLRALYRVLLIVPWAVPNYITALTWRGLFHREFGAVTALIEHGRALGLDIAPIDWFARFATAFSANLATNVWLGFPFMMVVTIAAMTGLPKEVLEAAEVDGATRWQRFWRVTLPIIRPSMIPAAVLGGIWTFNMFNIVYLVSGGQPDGQTDTLVSEAYRWAFTRQAQYGYATAYAVLIFALLFGATRLPDYLRRRRAGAEAS
jgi:arabinogalactan oligomer / maltooligosaccharide transport system permease protein